MKHLVGLMAVLVSGACLAQTDGFDGYVAGKTPDGWTCGKTGKGSPRWTVVAEPGAPSQPHVLKHEGQADFSWCAKNGTDLADGFVEVKFKAASGKQDQAGGVVWRWKDGDNYYVARANALENNVSLYYTERGKRKTLKYVDAPVALGAWHTLRVDFEGKHIVVLLNGKPYIELDDKHISGPGAVGVWTKADSNTSFDDFTHGARSR